jgi:hypothetical protein
MHGLSTNDIQTQETDNANTQLANTVTDNAKASEGSNTDHQPNDTIKPSTNSDPENRAPWYESDPVLEDRFRVINAMRQMQGIPPRGTYPVTVTDALRASVEERYKNNPSLVLKRQVVQVVHASHPDARVSVDLLVNRTVKFFQQMEKTDGITCTCVGMVLMGRDGHSRTSPFREVCGPDCS